MSEVVLVDANVLIATMDASRRSFLAARSFVESDPRDLIYTNQIEREFLNALTRPTSSNGYGLSGEAAVAKLGEATGTLRFVPESQTSAQQTRRFVSTGRAAGKQVHDANLVAVALEHGATVLVTDNLRHFERFADLITIEPLI